MSDVASIMNSEDFKFLMEEVGPDGFLTSEDDVIPEAYDTVPSNESFSGPYSFDVGIPGSRSLVYSGKLQKLFIKMMNDFTVQFMWDYQVKKQFFVRAKPRFSNNEDANKSVKRCLQHAFKEDHSNQDANRVIRHHVMRCRNTQAIYEGGPDQHFSIYVPLCPPETGTDFVPHTYQFVCQNSCASGMNRRPIEVIFTLEDENGDIHGRKSVNVRICSCPKRDCEKEELELGDIPAGQPPPGKRRKAVKRKHSQPVENVENDNSVHRVHGVTVNVLGMHSKKAFLQNAYNTLAVGMVLHPDDENVFKPILEMIVNQLNNC